MLAIFADSSHAFLCSDIFTVEKTPSQQTQYYVTKDLYTYRNIKSEFFEQLKEATNMAQPETHGSIQWMNRQSHRLYNEFQKNLENHSRSRLKKQIKKIEEYKIFEDPTSDQLTSIKHILKKLRKLRRYLDEQPEHHKLKSPIAITQVKRSYQRQSLYQVRQHEFLTLFTHSLMHQFFEVTSLKASHPLEGIPVSYMSTGWKFKDSLEKMWDMMNSAPNLSYSHLVEGPGSSKAHLDITNDFVDKMQAYLARMDKAIHKFELDKHFDLRQLKKNLNNFERMANVEKDKLVQQSITEEEYVKNLISSGNGLAGHIKTHLGEVWVLSRLPILGHHFRVNANGADLLGRESFETTPAHLLKKEFDIYSEFNVFGRKIHFAGEVKFFNTPLRGTEGVYIDKLKRQISHSRKILKKLGEDYEIHIFLIRGVHIDTKNYLEYLGATVHGPVFKN